MELYPPAKTPRGWYVLYQPEYKTPNVFNLNEKGLFKKKPNVTKDYGARVLVSESLSLSIQYMRLIEKNVVDEEKGETYSCININGLIGIDEKLRLDEAELSKLDSELKEEIRKVYDEWHKSVPKKEDEFQLKLRQAVENGKKQYWEYLVKKNSSWIKPYLPRMIYDFKNGIYQRIRHILYEDYKRRGGQDKEDELIKKINIFVKLYENEGVIKADGTEWISEDEIWDCWCAFCGSEEEAERICKTMESVIVPLRDELEEEVKLAEAA